VSPEVEEFSMSDESFITDCAVLTKVTSVVLFTGGGEEVVFVILRGLFEILAEACVVLMELGGEEDGLLESGVVVVLSGPVVVFFSDGGGIVLSRETEVLGGRPVV